MKPIPDDFAERLIRCEPVTPAYREKYEKEKQAMLEKQLSRLQRAMFIFWAVFGFTLAVVFAVAAVMTSGQERIAIPITFGLSVPFCAGFGVIAARIARSGKMRLKTDPAAMTAIMWVFIVMLNAIGLMIAPVPPEMRGIYMVLFNLVFLVGGVAFLVTTRTEQAELRTKEKLLEIEYRLAELAERLAPPSKAE